MASKTASSKSIALALLGLAITACSGAEQSGGEGRRSAPEMSEQAQHAGQRSAHGDAPGAHGRHDHHEAGHGQPEAGLRREPHADHLAHGNRHERHESTERMGREVSDFAVTDNAGNSFALASLRGTSDSSGKVVVLTFWCTTCHSCRQIEKQLEAKAKEYSGKGVRFLAVDSNFSDSTERVNRFLAENALSFTVVMDSKSEIARYFGARYTTTTAVIDAEGRLRYFGGFGKAEDAVGNLMAGEAVAVPESSGIG